MTRKQDKIKAQAQKVIDEAEAAKVRAEQNVFVQKIRDWNRSSWDTFHLRYSVLQDRLTKMLRAQQQESNEERSAREAQIPPKQLEEQQKAAAEIATYEEQRTAALKNKDTSNMKFTETDSCIWTSGPGFLQFNIPKSEIAGCFQHEIQTLNRAVGEPLPTDVLSKEEHFAWMQHHRGKKLEEMRADIERNPRLRECLAPSPLARSLGVSDEELAKADDEN